MSFGPNSTVSELVIVDTGPLIGLARIDRLELIRQLWNRVVVPPTVWREAVVEVPEAPGAPRIRAAANWIEIVESDEDLLAPIALLLDQGEAEALALAVGNRNATVLLELELYAKDSRIAILKDGTKLPVSRAGYGRLRELL